MHLLDLPHHDGSALYVSDARPALGDTVTLWVRVPAGYAVAELQVRTVIDGEPRFFAAMPDPGRTGPDTWWRVDVRLHNTAQRYRFHLIRPSAAPAWLTAAGTVEHDVPDATDFRLLAYDAPPDWAQDAIVYEIFPDRFARSAGAADRPTPVWALPCDWDTTPVIGAGPGASQQLFGGDLDGVIEHLDHIQGLGANTIYLTPVFPGRSNHRYDASTFDSVDPLLGGDAALRRLADAAHARGMRLIGDITTNHCGDAHEWFVRASTDVTAAEREMFYFGPDGEYECWWGVKTLPKFNWNAESTRTRMIEVLHRWAPFFDGWRVDVANMTGRFGSDDLTIEVAALLRAALLRVAPDALFVAEHTSDGTPDLDQGGWQATMNYGGFTRPVWNWLSSPSDADYIGVPGGVPSRDGQAVWSTMRAFAGQMSWRTLAHSWQLLDSHDAARIRTVVGSRARHLVAACLQATLPGPPMIFAGSEFGLTGWNGESSRTPMPWAREAARDEDTLSAYRTLMGLRRDHHALRRGGLRWAYVSADALVYLREAAEETILVAARRSAGPAIELPGIGTGQTLYGGADLTGGIIPASAEASAHVWRL